jgi:hypothetical protein
VVLNGSPAIISRLGYNIVEVIRRKTGYAWRHNLMTYDLIFQRTQKTHWLHLSRGLDKCGSIFIIISLCSGVGVISAVYLYSTDELALIYYSDSISHLVRAREILDSSSPGFQQIGTVWLPLPHLILMPTSLVDFLFKSGFAGLASSLPSVAIASVILYKIIKTEVKISWISIIGVCTFLLNPNVVYLGITPMTEAPFMLFFVSSAYYFQKCSILSNSSKCCVTSVRKEETSLNQRTSIDHSQKDGGDSKLHSLVQRNLIKCSLFVSLATLCRYEAWPITILPIIYTAAIFARRPKHKAQRILSCRIPKRLICYSILLPFSGIIFWISYNWYYYADPLEFFDANYYSASAQALEGQNRQHLYLQPLNVASTYATNAIAMYGPIIIAGAAISLLMQTTLGPYKQIRRNALYIFLAIPSAATFAALLFGVAEMNNTWYNSRFLMLLSPLLALLVSILVRAVAQSNLKSKLYLSLALSTILLIYPVVATPFFGEIVTFVDARNSISFGSRPAASEMARILDGLYHGGNILIITGSQQQNIIMQASSIPLSNYKTAIDGPSNNNPILLHWKDSQYIILSKHPDSSAQTFHNRLMEKGDEVEKCFFKLYENSYYVLMRSKNSC